MQRPSTASTQRLPFGLFSRPRSVQPFVTCLRRFLATPPITRKICFKLGYMPLINSRFLSEIFSFCSYLQITASFKFNKLALTLMLVIQPEIGKFFPMTLPIPGTYTVSIILTFMANDLVLFKVCIFAATQLGIQNKRLGITFSLINSCDLVARSSSLPKIDGLALKRQRRRIEIH